MGVIALVFLLTGYQTALLIHDAAVTKIAANRDMPDTVYIYKNDETHLPPPEAEREIVYARHAPKAEAVRRNVPYPKTESFPFDPNTVSVEELCRLGFTPKQIYALWARLLHLFLRIFTARAFLLAIFLNSLYHK